MSISGISAYSNWWQWLNQSTTSSTSSSSTTATTTSSTGDSITNSGSVAASSNLSSFLQAFSADLQAMLTQLGSDTTSTSAASSTTDSSSSSSQAASSQSQGTVHHHHHHEASDGSDGGSLDDAANQLVDEIGSSVQGGTLSSGQISQSASLFASDVMQALESYGTTTATTSASSILA
jgi:trimeric autotransporter adhesin